jgi:hypothetical protein
VQSTDQKNVKNNSFKLTFFLGSVNSGSLVADSRFLIAIWEDSIGRGDTADTFLAFGQLIPLLFGVFEVNAKQSFSPAAALSIVAGRSKFLLFLQFLKLPFLVNFALLYFIRLLNRSFGDFELRLVFEELIDLLAVHSESERLRHWRDLLMDVRRPDCGTMHHF